MINELLDNEMLTKIDKFNLRARLIVEGFIIGLHKSPYHGFSVEFSDHRQYNPGDEIKNIDWKVYAKTNRYYIRRYEEETNLKCYILLDHSKSMGYTSLGIDKLNYAKTLAASLSYLMLSQQDAVSLMSFTDKITNFLPPKSVNSYLNIVLKYIQGLNAESRTNTHEVLHALANRIKKRGLVILISDLVDDPEKILNGLLHFRHDKHEVIVFHIQDRQEINFAFDNETIFVDSETNERITVSPWLIKNEYRKYYSEQVEYLKTKCSEANIEYNQVTTDLAFDKMLMEYLIKRSKLM